VEALDETAAQAVGSLREVLEQHRANPACRGCHQVMDEIGLGLETFDGLGRLRLRGPDGKPIDAGGVLPGDQRFRGGAELAEILARDERLAGCFVEKALVYSLGRGLEGPDDARWVEQIARSAQAEDASIRAVLRAIVSSRVFRNRRG
jgi:hypothetical protein